MTAMKSTKPMPWLSDIGGVACSYSTVLYFQESLQALAYSHKSELVGRMTKSDDHLRL